MSSFLSFEVIVDFNSYIKDLKQTDLDKITEDFFFTL